MTAIFRRDVRRLRSPKTQRGHLRRRNRLKDQASEPAQMCNKERAVSRLLCLGVILGLLSIPAVAGAARPQAHDTCGADSCPRMDQRGPASPPVAPKRAPTRNIPPPRTFTGTAAGSDMTR